MIYYIRILSALIQIIFKRSNPVTSNSLISNKTPSYLTPTLSIWIITAYAMKKKKTIISTLPKASTPLPQNWRGLHQEWSDAVSKSSQIHFEIHHRDEHLLQSKQLLVPNRHDLFLIFLITGGEGVQTFGNDDYYLKPGILCFVSEGILVTKELTINDHAGYVSAFTSAFFSQNLSDKDSLLRYPFFNAEGSVSLQLDNEQTSYFYQLFRKWKKNIIQTIHIRRI
jgi:hypothetical protein